MDGKGRCGLRNRSASDRGAQAVEFAVIVPVLLALVYGLVAFGFSLNAKVTATQLAREGARVAAICGMQANCDSTARARINNALPPGYSLVSVVVTTCASATADASVTVQTKPPLNFPPFLTSGTQIKGKATTPCGG